MHNIISIKDAHLPFCHTFARRLGANLELTTAQWTDVMDRIDPNVRTSHSLVEVFPLFHVTVISEQF